MGSRGLGLTMGAVFLSASVPVPRRGTYFERTNPQLIQFAVREFVTTVLGRKLLVWGGHPAITPMVWRICEDLGVRYSEATVLYQSRFFEDQFPVENARFKNVRLIDAHAAGRAESLAAMRRQMFEDTTFDAAVFIGGMEGIFEEYAKFVELQPKARIVPVAAPGGAAGDLAAEIMPENQDLKTLDFAQLFATFLSIAPNAPRGLGAKKEDHDTDQSLI